MKIVGGYILAVLVTYLLGAAFVSQGNISAVTSMGFEVALGHRIDAVIHDVTHMYDIYLPLVAIGLLIGLPVAALVIRFVPGLRLVGYVLAGFVAMIALHMIARMVLGVSGIAPTREIMGLLLQGVAGACGGYAYHLLTRKSAA